MRVLIDAHSAIQKKTGIGRYVKNLIEHMDGKNLDITLYTHSPVTKEFKKFPQYNAPMKNGIFRVFWGLNAADKKLAPEVVHISNFAPIIKTKPLVLTVHDLCFKSHKERYPIQTRLAFRLFFEMSLKKSDAIICVSKATKKELLKLFEVDPKKISVIYEAPDPVFRPMSNKEAKRKVKRRFNVKKPFFLVVGNIEPRKKPGLIRKAFEAFQKKQRNFELVFVGPNLVEEKAKKGTKILGFVEDGDLNLLYNASEALVYYSECEGFGLPLLEAMATKTPVICSNLKVFHEVAGTAALFVKNQKELAKAMEKIVEDKKTKKQLVRKGIKRQRQFNWDKIAKETLKVYQKLL